MSRVREEGGWSLVTAIMLMAIMAGMALAAFAVVETQQEQSGHTRKRETAYNLAEAVMNAQIYALSRDWAGEGQALTPYTPCTQVSTGSRCPSSTTISGLFASPDTETGMTWRTEVHDNDDPNEAFYSETTTRLQPGYDANGDHKVWVRSQATARGKTRTLIALVGTQELTEDLPHAALITGRLSISNKGHKPIIDADGGSSVSGLIAVRCTPQLLETSACLGHKLGSLVSVLTGTLGGALTELEALLNYQIEPNVTVKGYTSTSSMSEDARLRLKTRAIADGTYHPTCPAALPEGRIVYIETGNCFYQANADINSPAEPGVIIMADGTLRLAGTIQFYGIIYHANTTGSTGNLVHLDGDVQVHGGVLVDGSATTTAGSSKVNIQLDLDAFDALKSYGSAGVIQNTYREIKGR